jgi:hypothetical protein
MFHRLIFDFFFFWLCHQVLGAWGFALAQVLELGGNIVLEQGRTKLSWDFPLIFSDQRQA